jgi:hypothetical protein
MSKSQKETWPVEGRLGGKDDRVVMVRAAGSTIDEHTTRIWGQWVDIAPS